MVVSATIDSLLSARLLLQPHPVGERLYFLSDLSGRLSLYAMDAGGGMPEPLLPPEVGLFNPKLMRGHSFCVLPDLGRILVMIDRDGDERHQACFISIDGGHPEPLFGDRFRGQQVNCSRCDPDRNLAVLQIDPRGGPDYRAFLADLRSLELTDLGSSRHGNWCIGASRDFSKLVLIDFFAVGDHAVYLWERGAGGRRLIHGVPAESRTQNEILPPNSIGMCHFTTGDRGLLCVTCVFEDRYGLAYLPLDPPGDLRRVEITGPAGADAGELESLEHVEGSRYVLTRNADGCSIAWEGAFDENSLRFTIDIPVAGTWCLTGGVLESMRYDRASRRYAASFSSADSPSQLYTIDPRARRVQQLSRNRILGIPSSRLSRPEDASFVSHDGLRVHARLYLPARELGFAGPRPIVFYIHGGPQRQERPDFTWFSMPLIQLLTLHGVAVFVPNARGSSGYGLEYMKRIDRDWGGQDRLDHVAGFAHLRRDDRLDMTRTGVVGRSYGGYMTLMLASRHPELWRAACSMFSSYNMLTWIERIPETGRTIFCRTVGDPVRDRDFLIERSPSTYLHQLACPLLLVQGANDPRVLVPEMEQMVHELREQGKTVETLVFADEGHDVLKRPNKARCFGEIVRFFSHHLRPVP